MIKKSTMIVVVVFSSFQLSTSVIEAESKDELTDAQIKELGKEDPKIIKEKHASSNDEGKEELEKSQESSISDEDADLFKPYQIGDQGDRIIQLKRDLTSLGYGKFSEHPSQHYDSETEDVVKKFQLDYDLNETGIADKDTLEKIEEVLSTFNQESDIDDSEETEEVEDEDPETAKEAGPSEEDSNAPEEGKVDEKGDSETSGGIESDEGEDLETSEDTEIDEGEKSEAAEEDELNTSQDIEPKKDKKHSFTVSSFKSTSLKKGVRDPKVIELKNNLNKLGYGGITVTNYYGSFTEKRVKQFQEYYGLKVTGEADQATLSKIASLLPNPLSQGKRHKDTIPLKKDLNKLGYGGITVTNYFGSFTEKRVKQFQNYYGLKVTGEADQATLSKIASLLPNPLSQGKRHKDTIPLKKDLNKLGYGGITVTNYFGSFTEKRVKQFQNYYGLKVTGEADQATLSKIASLLPNPLSQGKRHKDTIPLKKDLNKLGYGGITVTNYYGSFTEKRVKQFQEYYGLKVTGEADQATLSKIASLLPNPLSKGKRHKDTIAFKRNLNNIGFGGITVTNYYGSFTEKRVKQFQKHYGLKVTGKGDEATLSEVNKIVSSPMQFGKRHPETVDLKKRLNSIGYGGITVTNYFGKFTEKRLKEFQADNGLPVSGIADEVTLRAISNQDVVKIFIDPGHGGQDPGASGHGLKEKNVVLEIALRVADVLTKNYLGVDVQLSRTADTFIELEERASQANAWGADYFVSIHNNAFNGSAHGFESYIYNDNVSQTTKDKQKDVHQYISSSLNVNDRGMKDANFSVLRNTSMPAILLELLFIDNKAEANKLGSTQFKNKLGNIVANAIAKSYSLKKR